MITIPSVSDETEIKCLFAGLRYHFWSDFLSSKLLFVILGSKRKGKRFTHVSLSKIL